MKLYLAGPMTGLPDFNRPAFNAEAARLRALGHVVVNPVELNEGNDGNWMACMKVDIRELIECDGIALLPGWFKSRGAKIECQLAVDLGLEVFHCKMVEACAI